MYRHYDIVIHFCLGLNFATCSRSRLFFFNNLWRTTKGGFKLVALGDSVGEKKGWWFQLGKPQKWRQKWRFSGSDSRWVSVSIGWFSGFMLVLRGVIILDFGWQGSLDEISRIDKTPSDFQARKWHEHYFLKDFGVTFWLPILLPYFGPAWLQHRIFLMYVLQLYWEGVFLLQQKVSITYTIIIT